MLTGAFPKPTKSVRGELGFVSGRNPKYCNTLFCNCYSIASALKHSLYRNSTFKYNICSARHFVEGVLISVCE